MVFSSHGILVDISDGIKVGITHDRGANSGEAYGSVESVGLH
jgi:hypothetical protein